MTTGLDCCVPMKLFFYCSTPSMGFVLKQIDFRSGNVLEEGEGAARSMPDEVFAIMTRGSARMALFEIGEELCFLAKNIRSTAKDHYGRQKYVSIAFLANNEDKGLLRQFAAWALLDFQIFSERLTDCLEVFDGPKGYTVDVDAMRELIGCIQREAPSFPEKKKIVWQRVVTDDSDKKYLYLLMDASLEYFNRMTKLDVSRQQISMLISDEEFQEWNENPSFESLTGKAQYNKAYEKSKENDGEEGKVYKRDCYVCEDKYIDLLKEKWFWILLGGGVLLLLVGSVIYAVRHLVRW